MLDNGRVVDYDTHLNSLFAVRHVHSFVNFAYFLEKGYPVSPSSLVSFSEIFLWICTSLSSWKLSLNSFISAIFQHFLHFLSISLSSWRFITAFTRRWLSRCRRRWQILLNGSNTRSYTRSNTRSYITWWIAPFFTAKIIKYSYYSTFFTLPFCFQSSSIFCSNLFDFRCNPFSSGKVCWMCTFVTACLFG